MPARERDGVVEHRRQYLRERRVVDALERGHERVFNLEGGLFGWANAGRPVWAEGSRAAKVHPYDDEWGRLLRPALRSPLPD